jgi:hypothetical protein
MLQWLQKVRVSRIPTEIPLKRLHTSLAMCFKMLAGAIKTNPGEDLLVLTLDPRHRKTTPSAAEGPLLQGSRCRANRNYWT